MNDTLDPVDQGYIKTQYSYEICLLFEELTEIQDYERLNPKNFGIDQNFLAQELQRSEAEELIERMENYEEVIERQESDWHRQIIEIFEDIIHMVNTKILYVIYRQVKLVYARR